MRTGGDSQLEARGQAEHPLGALHRVLRHICWVLVAQEVEAELHVGEIQLAQQPTAGGRRQQRGFREGESTGAAIGRLLVSSQVGGSKNGLHAEDERTRHTMAVAHVIPNTLV